MRLVHHQQEVAREIVKQRERNGARLSAREDAGVVLDAVAEAGLAQHFNIVHRALLDALRFDQPVVRAEILHALAHLFFYAAQALLTQLVGDDIMRGGIDAGVVQLRLDLAGQDVDLGKPLDLVAEKLDADRGVGVICGVYLHDVAADAELVADEVYVVALVFERDELAYQRIAVPFHARA